VLPSPDFNQFSDKIFSVRVSNGTTHYWLGYHQRSVDSRNSFLSGYWDDEKQQSLGKEDFLCETKHAHDEKGKACGASLHIYPDKWIFVRVCGNKNV